MRLATAGTARAPQARNRISSGITVHRQAGLRDAPPRFAEQERLQDRRFFDNPTSPVSRQHLCSSVTITLFVDSTVAGIAPVDDEEPGDHTMGDALSTFLTLEYPYCYVAEHCLRAPADCYGAASAFAGSAPGESLRPGTRHETDQARELARIGGAADGWAET